MFNLVVVVEKNSKMECFLKYIQWFNKVYLYWYQLYDTVVSMIFDENQLLPTHNILNTTKFEK